MKFLEELTRTQFHGFIILAIGIAMMWFVQRRRFNRRGPAGQQQYSNFETGCLTTIFESVIMLLGVVGFLFGLIMILIDYI